MLAVNSAVAVLKLALSGVFFVVLLNSLMKTIKRIEMKGALRTLAGVTACCPGGDHRFNAIGNGLENQCLTLCIHQTSIPGASSPHG